MISSPLSPTDKIAIGNASAWHLTFLAEKLDGAARYPDVEGDPVLEIGSDQYHAEIQATISSNLEGGLFSFIVEGLTDAHYSLISRREKPADPKTYAEYVNLYLYWLDANASAGSYLKNLSGLTGSGGVRGKDLGKDAFVTTLKIETVTRRAGQRRHETSITARDWIFDRVSSRRLCGDPISGTDPKAVLKALLAKSAQMVENKHFFYWGAAPNATCPPAPPETGPRKFQLNAGTKVIEHLQTIGNALEAATGCYGRGMILLRDGQIHVGTRAIPMPDEDAEPKHLGLATGLIESEALETLVTDPNFDYCSAGPDGKPPSRRQFRLTLKGRPDLKPGDVVLFNPAPEDVATTGGGLLGALGDAASAMTSSLLPSLGEQFNDSSVRLYVDSVQHKLGRTTSFVTTVNGVEIPETLKVWDCHTDGDHHESASRPTHVDLDIETARAVKELTRIAVASLAQPEVGEVRLVTSSGPPTTDPPGQTLTVWRGVEPNNSSYLARVGTIKRPSDAPSDAVPYATPFAWGKCGLVLPRYPGTRVFVVHRGGRDDDPVDVGAVWESGHGPDSKSGDWWLILPVGVDQARRDHLDDPETPQEHAGPVSQDLIDADGNRVISVGELTIKVGRKSLKNAGDRPDRGTTDAITISHADGGASVVIDGNGKVTITAKQIDIKSTEGDISLDAGSKNINMKAENVNVTVGTSMNIK